MTAGRATAGGAPSRVLLVRLSHLGDVVLSLPVFHAIAHAWPNAEIAWAVQTEFAPLVAGMPGIARVFQFERKRGFAAWARMREELLAWASDVAVDAQGNVKSAMVALASGAPRRIGMAREDWTEPFAAGAATEQAPSARGAGGGTPSVRGARGVHGMERALALAAHVAPGAPVRRDPALTSAELARGAAELAARFPAARPGWILHLAREEDVRSWPAAAFEELALDLARADGDVLVLSGPREQELGERAARHLRALPLASGRVHSWTGQRGLRELAAFFAAAARAGHRLVACDSGPAHLAAAVDLPVTLLAGPQDPRRTGPWPPPDVDGRSPHRALRAARPPPCEPCFARRCDHPRGPVCMRDIQPRDVARALLAERR